MFTEGLLIVGNNEERAFLWVEFIGRSAADDEGGRHVVGGVCRCRDRVVIMNPCTCVRVEMTDNNARKRLRNLPRRPIMIPLACALACLFKSGPIQWTTTASRLEMPITSVFLFYVKKYREFARGGVWYVLVYVRPRSKVRPPKLPYGIQSHLSQGDLGHFQELKS